MRKHLRATRRWSDSGNERANRSGAGCAGSWGISRRSSAASNG